MKARPFRSRILAIPVALVLAGGLSACENPVEGEHEEHPIGFAISNAQGQSVATVTATGTVTGQLTAQVGTSQTYTVVGIDEDGDVLAITGGDLALRVSAVPPQANVALQGGNQVVVTGLAAGSGTVRLDLLHDGHEEVGNAVPVVIAPETIDPS